ncbi:MAG: protoporphyrinogen oxidase [Ignavibacteriales bacterium]|nr:protoporphyrinogen oxidase [Ignavibacteriales bacterium]
MTSSHITIIGGGISGLATAWWLKKKGLSVTLFEQDAEVGGTMKTVRKDGWLIETGPNSALETTPLFKTLFADLGIENELVYANPAGKNRYILRNGTLHPLPMSPGKFLKSKLWSLPAKLRLLKEPFVGRAQREESIAEFVVRRLGREFLDYAINPFVAGIFAGSPEKLSVRAAFPKLYALEEKYGGLIRGQIKGARERKKRREVAKDRAQMFSFKNGMQTFPCALSRALGDAVRTSCAVERIGYNENEKSYTVQYSMDGAGRAHETNAIIFAVPASAAGRFVASFDDSLANIIQDIYYPPVTEVFVGYKKEQVKQTMDGFGFLIPEKEKRKILGAIWSSTLFEDRAPEGSVAITAFVGGSRQPENALKNDNELLSMVRDELQELMQINGGPVFTSITRWEKAIPQYHLGHLQIVEQMSKFEAEHPGLFLSGNYRGGISVSDCITQSEKVSDHVTKYLESQKIS